MCGFDSVEKIDAFTVDFTPRIQNLRFPEQVLHPKGAIAEVLRDGAGNPVAGPASTQTPGISSPRNLGRHLDGSTGGLPAGTQYFGIVGSPPATPLVTGTPQGTGPFKFVSYSPTSPQGGGTASFVTNPTYWGPKALVAGMNYTFIADPAVRTAGLQSGQYDMVIDLDPLAVAGVQSAGKRVVTAPYGQNSLIYVNRVVKTSPATVDLTKSPPATPANYRFDIGTDPAVRKASSLALDRAAYMSAIYANNAALGRWMGPPNILGTYQNLVTPMAFDQAGAATTLDTDGWTCGAGAPGAGTACATNEIRAWHGDARFTTGRSLTLYMIGISLVPQSGYDLMAAQMKAVGINVVTERGSCDSAAICPDGTVGRGQMYNTSLWDFDVELPNQNDANAAFLPVLRQACVNESSTFRFAPADGTNAVTASVTDTVANGGGTYPNGKTPCTGAGAVLGPMDTTWVPQSLGATTQAINQEAAANMMAILCNQTATNVVIPIVGQFRIYGMNSNVNLTGAHPSQTSQRWLGLTKS
jgi:ABC-type transport system substrate-binding protein